MVIWGWKSSKKLSSGDRSTCQCLHLQKLLGPMPYYVDHILGIEVGGDVKLSRADIRKGDKCAGEQGRDIVSSVALTDGEWDKVGRCEESSIKVITEI